jgi:hypothetical protein
MRILPNGMTTFGRGDSGVGFRSNPSMIDTSKRYVLVVEDNKMNSDILVEMLSYMNMESIVAVNGKIAVEKFT